MKKIILEKITSFNANVRNPMNHAPSSLGSFLIPLVIVCFAFSPQTRAACGSPDPGCPTGNLAEGYLALGSLTTGAYNTGIGAYSLLSLTDNAFCTAVGAETLLANTADNNTATGAGTLLSNSTGDGNTANGAFALFFNTIGSSNTATGGGALFVNTTGSFNTANGAGALFNNSTGISNTATGSGALQSNTAGNLNTANGLSALLVNSTGKNNTATGFQALQSNSNGSFNIALGSAAGSNLTTGDRNIDIGNAGVAGESDTIRIGTVQTDTFIAGISGATVPGGVTVIADADGHLGTIPSSQRFKDEIRPMDKASEAILALKPVTFRYKQELDPDGIPQFGLVAEEVEKVNPDLVARDARGEVYTVRYEAVNAMLLNEFLKEHRKSEEQEATIARQQKQIEALTAGLQKVSAQFEASKPAPQVVNNP